MSADQLSAMRTAMVERGLAPEAVDDMVAQIGADGFIKHAVAVEGAAARGEARAADRATAGASAFEYELLLRVLGVDPAGPGTFNDALGRIHHLVDHSVAGGCALARRIVEEDPLRIARQPEE